MNNSKPLLILTLFLAVYAVTCAQPKISGIISANHKPVHAATVSITETGSNGITDSLGRFQLSVPATGNYTLVVTAASHEPLTRVITVSGDTAQVFHLNLTEHITDLDDVVVTGTLRPVSRSHSPVPVEIYTAAYFNKNPSPSLLESVGMINGVRPQINCNVCNTGDIRINGMEGPYTMILIDGMPIVSSLSTVYGLSGIPLSLIERVEVVKGPGASLYGSEAMGGIINVITKDPAKAPLMSVDLSATTWREINTDIAMKLSAGKARSLIGINYFNYQHPIDHNKDGFTDITLQQRISAFNKWSIERKKNQVASFAARYVYEDRWGGQMSWNKWWRGSDSIYGESIYTKRIEVISQYQLPMREKIMLQGSYNFHEQNSYYGNTSYQASQQVAFIQAFWDKQIGNRHTVLTGIAFRYTDYDDNTPATMLPDGKTNAPVKTPLPGIFLQDEWVLASGYTLLLGYRFDHDHNHGGIHSPRVAFKWTIDDHQTLRTSFGTGFRVVNLFTEDHAALTGSREVIILEDLKPERSCNANINYVLKIPAGNAYSNLDITGFYSYFTNKITGDYDSDPDKIIYDNLKGHAVSRGISLNIDMVFSSPLKLMTGLSYMDVFQKERDLSGNMGSTRQLFAPKWSGTYSVTYKLPKQFSFDLTGNWNGPMRLPVQQNDYRPDYSPWFTIINLQLSKKFNDKLEVYGGIKNLLNYVPGYALMRPFDPFDKSVNDPVNNPFGYTFDTEYNYASLQGIRGLIGVRLLLK